MEKRAGVTQTDTEKETDGQRDRQTDRQTEKAGGETTHTSQKFSSNKISTNGLVVESRCIG